MTDAAAHGLLISLRLVRPFADRRFSVGDVFFAELFVAYSICVNGADLFLLEAGELFTCDLGDGSAYNELAIKFQSS